MRRRARPQVMWRINSASTSPKFVNLTLISMASPLSSSNLMTTPICFSARSSKLSTTSEMLTRPKRAPSDRVKKTRISRASTSLALEFHTGVAIFTTQLTVNISSRRRWTPKVNRRCKMSSSPNNSKQISNSIKFRRSKMLKLTQKSRPIATFRTSTRYRWPSSSPWLGPKTIHNPVHRIWLRCRKRLPPIKHHIKVK